MANNATAEELKSMSEYVNLKDILKKHIYEARDIRSSFYKGFSDAISSKNITKLREIYSKYKLFKVIRENIQKDILPFIGQNFKLLSTELSIIEVKRTFDTEIIYMNKLEEIFFKKNFDKVDFEEVKSWVNSLFYLIVGKDVKIDKSRG